MPETIKSEESMALKTTLVRRYGCHGLRNTCTVPVGRGGKEEDPILLNRFQGLHKPEVQRSGRGTKKQAKEALVLPLCGKSGLPFGDESARGSCLFMEMHRFQA